MLVEVTIRHRHTGTSLFTVSVNVQTGAEHGITLRDAVAEAVKAEADLTGADLRSANFDNYIGYPWFPGADLTGASFIKCDLSGGNFESATLTGATFFNGFLRKCNFSNADLRHSYWDNASVDRGYFRGADFSDATFRNASFFEIHMENAKFLRADFNPEVMEGNLRGADFSGARFAPQVFGGDIDGVKIEEAIIDPRFKAEFWSELVYNHPHVAALRDALAAGEIRFKPPGAREASLWRTWRAICKDTTRGYPLRPGEKELCNSLFDFLRPGDRPDGQTVGGFVLRLLIGWIDEYLRLTSSRLA